LRRRRIASAKVVAAVGAWVKTVSVFGRVSTVRWEHFDSGGVPERW
jgi:hypothetical protein